MTPNEQNEKRQEEQMRMSELSGSVTSKSLLVAFLYELLRDSLPSGDLEQIMLNIERSKGKKITYTNGWLANYAKDIASRLREKKT